MVLGEVYCPAVSLFCFDFTHFAVHYSTEPYRRRSICFDLCCFDNLRWSVFLCGRIRLLHLTSTSIGDVCLHSHCFERMGRHRRPCDESKLKWIWFLLKDNGSTCWNNVVFVLTHDYHLPSQSNSSLNTNSFTSLGKDFQGCNLHVFFPCFSFFLKKSNL